MRYNITGVIDYTDTIHRINVHSLTQLKQVGKVSKASIPRRLLTLAVNFKDATPDCSIEEMKNILWEKDLGVYDYFNKVSFGEVRYTPATIEEAANDFATVDIDFSIIGHNCDADEYTKLALEAARSKGINTDLYTNIIYLISPEYGTKTCGL